MEYKNLLEIEKYCKIRYRGNEFSIDKKLFNRLNHGDFCEIINKNKVKKYCIIKESPTSMHLFSSVNECYKLTITNEEGISWGFSNNIADEWDFNFNIKKLRNKLEPNLKIHYGVEWRFGRRSLSLISLETDTVIKDNCTIITYINHKHYFDFVVKVYPMSYLLVNMNLDYIVIKRKDMRLEDMKKKLKIIPYVYY